MARKIARRTFLSASMRLALAGLALAAIAAAQIITGSLVGTVVDPSGLPVPTATVILTHVETNRARSTETGPNGAFAFNGLEPGQYEMTISHDGFKRSARSGITLVSGERVSAGDIALEIGQSSETVTVTGEAATVKTESSERAGIVTSAQVSGLLIQGRNPASLVQLLPGVVVTQESGSLDRRTDFSVMGNRRTANNVTIDGIPTVDMDNGFAMKMNINMDAVSEVQVLISNYQAEFGRNAGSNVQIVMKSGTKDFHGLGSYFKRHEQFNANNFFNNFNGAPKSRYRYNTWTYNIGGPVIIPKLFNNARNRLFFFWSQEYWPNKQGSLRNLTMPTALERQGDFSQSLDLNDRLTVIRDPRANSPFPGNRIPASRIDSNGRALLNVFDQPNFFDRSVSRGNYNYLFSTEVNAPKRSDALKVDLNLNANNQVFVTYAGFDEVSEGQVGSTGNNATWPAFRQRFHAPNRAIAVRYTRVFSPSTINEFHAGWLRNPEGITWNEDSLARIQRDKAGFTLGQFVAANNPFGIIPQATFGGVPNPGTHNINGRFPQFNQYDILTWNDKVTLVRRAHTMKAGIYGEWFRRNVNQAVPFNGQFDFGRNANNPLDTGYAYANAVLGVFNSYTEPTARPRMFARGGGVEWFVQDNWKVARRLTLDFGLRFNWVPPIYDSQDLLAGFDASRFDPAKRVKLIQPGLDAQGKRAGINPVTGQILPVITIGAIAPGSGDPANGMVTPSQDRSYPRGLMDDRGIMLGPRFGFAYDVFGDGKTAIRGGGGILYNRLSMTSWLGMTAQPPLVYTPVVNFGEMSTLLSSPGLTFPSNTQAFDRGGKVPTIANYSLSIQRSLGWRTVVEAGYAGSIGRHLYWQRDLNPIPVGANFKASNFDPTTPGRPYAPAFLRPITGYNNLVITEPASSSNYNSLQVGVNRRFAHGLQFGVSWTWSKSLDYNDADGGAVSALLPIRVWNYGLSSFDRTQVVKINYLWDIPTPNWRNPVVRLALRNWQLSGITTFSSGQPLAIGLSTVSALDITGTASQGARPDVLADPVLPKSEQTFYRFFNTEAFSLPRIGTFGNAPRTSIRGPGMNNFDMAVFKTFPVREKMRLQFRAEFYNVFNHTQFNAVDTAARFDDRGKQVNTRLGQFTSAGDARIGQLALRFTF